jgi:hypothetical protein
MLIFNILDTLFYSYLNICNKYIVGYTFRPMDPVSIIFHKT